ncbi:hypothetical protein [uncultured Gulosibacter sp.]|uniref:hypothetical protein n=1 Tax=uncultured Gulosibacter sp. TaxID=1339167 RepID=UPI002889581E|nr:hypothetical protein [uncultured Gulosibacter sp.]
MRITKLDLPGGPAVEVFEAALPAGTTTVTLWRLADGRQYQVRGAIQKAVAGELTHIDHEVPLGTEAVYRVECFDAAGTRIALTDGASVLVDVNGLWVHNPLDPNGGVECFFRGNAVFPVHAPNTGETQWVPGLKAGIFMAGTQRGIIDIDLSLEVETVVNRDKVITMLGRGERDLPPILCFRFGSDHKIPLPRPFFAAVPNYGLNDIDVRYGGDITHFDGAGNEVLPPAPGLFIPLLTYAHVNAVYDTYLKAKQDNLTYGELNRRYDLTMQ